jgi:hypothetical protein
LSKQIRDFLSEIYSNIKQILTVISMPEEAFLGSISFTIPESSAITT